MVFITYVYPPEHAPGGVMIEELAEDFARAGHRVTVVTGWPSHPTGRLFEGWRSQFRRKQCDERGFEVLRCGHSFGPRTRMVHRLWYYLTFAVSSFFGAMTLGKIDVIVCASTPIFGSWAGRLLAGIKGARFNYDIADLHPEAMRTAGLMGDGPLYRALRAQDTWLCRRADFITTLSDTLRKSIEARGVDPGKIRVIPFWLDGQKVHPGDRDNPWRRQHRVPTETFVALFAGTIGYISGAEMLVEVARLLSDRKDILLLVVGEGPVKDTLQVAAAEAKLANMRFLPFQPAAMLNDMQATADVGLVTLRPEAGEHSVPSKLLGYLAAGRPVIASVHGGSPTAQTLHQGRCGVVVPPNDPTAMAEVIRHAADHRRELTKMGRNAREHFLRCYERQSSVRQWEECITALAHQGRPAAQSRYRQ
ncbi:MAG: glycosyltransferase family 4 protein [Phycisphaerae bacterium]|nr:glycosyltransferase family 4 protein [Phycisphaerae bacterium]